MAITPIQREFVDIMEDTGNTVETTEQSNGNVKIVDVDQGVSITVDVEGTIVSQTS